MRGLKQEGPSRSNALGATYQQQRAERPLDQNHPLRDAEPAIFAVSVAMPSDAALTTYRQCHIFRRVLQ
jgi:hypothetical protein